MANILWVVKAFRRWQLGYGGTHRHLNPENIKTLRSHQKLSILRGGILRDLIAGLIRDREKERPLPSLRAVRPSEDWAPVSQAIQAAREQEKISSTDSFGPSL